jgi:hypothetical protein
VALLALIAAGQADQAVRPRLGPNGDPTRISERQLVAEFQRWYPRLYDLLMHGPRDTREYREYIRDHFAAIKPCLEGRRLDWELREDILMGLVDYIATHPTKS